MSGPLLIGPTPLTVNMPVQVKMAAETHAIYVQNYSRYTILVSFSDVQPTSTDSLNNQYDGVLQAGGRDVFYVQSRGASAMERSLNAMGAFTGSVWFMPIDRTGNQSNTGSVSQINDLWVSAYGPNDPPPPFPGGMPVNVDLSSQPRIITIPMTLSQSFLGTWNGVGTFDVTTFNASAAQVLAGFAPLYLYYINVIAATATGTLTFNVQAQEKDAGGAATGLPYIFCTGKVWANATNNTATQWEFRPPFALGKVGPLNPNTAKITVQFANVSGTPITVGFTLCASMDTRNISSPREIGNNPYNAGSNPLF